MRQPPADVVDEGVEGREDEERKERRAGQAADHHDRERPLDLRAVEAEEQQGQEAQDGGRSGHGRRGCPTHDLLAQKKWSIRTTAQVDTFDGNRSGDATRGRVWGRGESRRDQASAEYQSPG